MAKLTKDDVVRAIKLSLEQDHGVSPDSVVDTMTCQDLGIDSLDMFELLLAVEYTLKVEFNDTQLKATTTTPLGQLVDELLTLVLTDGQTP